MKDEIGRAVGLSRVVGGISLDELHLRQAAIQMAPVRIEEAMRYRGH